MSTDEILNEREKTHGDYSKVSLVTIDLWNAVNKDREIEYGPLTVEKKLAVSMILHKIARIICGDPNFSDHWDDIAGYARLGKGKEEPTEFEKKYCVPLDSGKGKIHFYTARCKSCLSMRLGPLGLPCDDCIKEYVDSVKAKEEEKELTEFEINYCAPLDGNKGTIYYGCYNCGAGENSSGPCIRCGTNV